MGHMIITSLILDIDIDIDAFYLNIVIFLRWPFLSAKFDGFTILIGSTISSNTCSNVLVWNLAHISLISWSFSKIFLLKIRLISTYKIPHHFPCYLIKVLSNLSPNIPKIGSSPYWPPGQHGASFLYANDTSDVTASFAYQETRCVCQVASMEN